VNSGYFFVGKDQAQQYSSGMENIPTSTKKVLSETDQFLSCP
jgi:hypothetical protein